MKSIFWLFLLAAALPCITTGQAAKSSLPNIIYIYADDLGYGELGCYGQEKILTPNLDRMAREGIRFTQHYAGAPVCAPSRCMLLTGRHGGHSYIRGNYELGGFEDDQEGGQMPIPEGTYTIAHLLRSAGYHTAAIGKWGLGMNNTSGDPNRQGFDYFYGYLDQKQAHNYYPTHLWENGRWDSLDNPFIYVHRKPDSGLTDAAAFAYYQGKDYSIDHLTGKALKFISKNRNHPFFLYLPYTLPHVSLQVPEDALAQYRGKFPETPYRGEKGYAASLCPRATYAAMITYLDTQVGIILKRVHELGIDGNTLIMFSSDNGPTIDVGGVDTRFFNSSCGLRGRKMDVYEGGIREPFLARWPGKIRPGRLSDHISSQYDLFATLAEIIGARASDSEGLSFLPTLLERGKQARHPWLYFEYPENNGQLAIRMNEWKAVKRNMKKNSQVPWEIYDLSTDPGETRDISESHPELIKVFDDILRKEHRSSHIREWEFVNPKF